MDSIETIEQMNSIINEENNENQNDHDINESHNNNNSNSNDDTEMNEEHENYYNNDNDNNNTNNNTNENENENENNDTNNNDDEINNNEIINNLLSRGINYQIASKLNELITSDIIKLEDFDDNSFEKLKELNENDVYIIDEYSMNDFSQIENKNELLINLINRLKAESEFENQNSNNSNRNSRPGPDENKLKELLEKSGYAHEVTAGQRKYGGPPPNWEGPSPGNGCEVFVGKLPKDVFEDLLIPLFEEQGRLWDLRIMVEPATGYTKGYAFVTYCDKDDAKKAADKLNGFEVKPGKSLRVNISIANVRLFVGNIPKTKSKEEIKEEFSKLIEGITEVIIYQPTEDGDKLKNRGFCFLDFESHKAAATARKKLLNTRLRLFNRDIAVEWAEQTDDPDDEQMSKVKTLYVRNISAEITEDEIKQKFEEYGGIERVKKVKDYAFVHYNERESALKAMDELNGKPFGKFNLIISLARPLSDNRKQPQRRDDKKRNDSMKPNFNNQNRNNKRGGNQMNINDNNFNESTFLAAMGNFMRNLNCENAPNPEAFAMQFAAAAAAYAAGGDMQGGNRRNNNYNNRGNNRGGRGGKYMNNNNNRSNNNNNNNRGNMDNGQGGKRKGDQNNVNDNKKGRFTNNQGFNDNNMNFHNASAYPIPQQSQQQQQQQQQQQHQQQQDFSQDFYAPQWS